MEQRQEINFDHPSSVEFELLVADLMKLKRGEPVNQPIYSYLTCTRAAETVYIEPKHVIIVEGILIFTNPELREMMDIKVFVDADPDDRLSRVVRRDIVERGRSVNKVLERYEKTVKPMVSVTVYHNDGLINTYWSDGLLVATPTGSTAYSLSVGGPIITPDSASFVISPIAPHNLTVRPLVVPDSYRLRIEPTSRDENVIVAIDNRSMPIASGSRLIISKAPFTVKILKLGETDFFKRLRTKLMWGVDKRS